MQLKSQKHLFDIVAKLIPLRLNKLQDNLLCFYFISDLRELFETVGLVKYFSIFQEQEVNLPVLLKDLSTIGQGRCR